MAAPFKWKRRKRGSKWTKHARNPSPAYSMSAAWNLRQREIEKRRHAGPWYDSVLEMMAKEAERAPSRIISRGNGG